MRKTWVQHPITHKLIPKDEYVRPRTPTPFIQRDVDPFVSSVDGSLISSRAQLRAHNEKYGVVTQAELGNEGRDAMARREDYYAGRPHDTERRKDAIKHAVDWHKEGRSKADIHQMSENYRKLNR